MLRNNEGIERHSRRHHARRTPLRDWHLKAAFFSPCHFLRRFSWRVFFFFPNLVNDTMESNFWQQEVNRKKWQNFVYLHLHILQVLVVLSSPPSPTHILRVYCKIDIVAVFPSPQFGGGRTFPENLHILALILCTVEHYGHHMGSFFNGVDGMEVSVRDFFRWALS